MNLSEHFARIEERRNELEKDYEALLRVQKMNEALEPVKKHFFLPDTKKSTMPFGEQEINDRSAKIIAYITSKNGAEVTASELAQVLQMSRPAVVQWMRRHLEKSSIIEHGINKSRYKIKKN